MKPYTYQGTKKLTPAQLLDMARAEAEDIIQAARTQAQVIIADAEATAIEQAKVTHELAYDQGLALAERFYASREERAADQQRAKDAILKRVGDRRLRAASFEVAGVPPMNIKPAHRLENVEYLVSAGCSVDEALNRSGYNSIDTFKRTARRHGRNDLVRYITERIAS